MGLDALLVLLTGSVMAIDIQNLSFGLLIKDWPQLALKRR